MKILWYFIRFGEGLKLKKLATEEWIDFVFGLLQKYFTEECDKITVLDYLVNCCDKTKITVDHVKKICKFIDNIQLERDRLLALNTFSRILGKHNYPIIIARLGKQRLAAAPHFFLTFHFVYCDATA